MTNLIHLSDDMITTLGEQVKSITETLHDWHVWLQDIRAALRADEQPPVIVAGQGTDTSAIVSQISSSLAEVATCVNEVPPMVRHHMSRASPTSHESTTRSCTGHHLTDGGRVVLGADDMCAMMTTSLRRLLGDGEHHGQICVTPFALGPTESVQRVLQLEQHNPMSLMRIKADAYGCSTLAVAMSRKFEWPIMAGEGVSLPTEDEALIFVQSTLNAHTSTGEEFPYYSGRVWYNRNNPSRLHPGEYLSRMEELPGLNEEHIHVGARRSAISMQKRDANLRACNVLDSGISVWVIIEREDTPIFEDWVRDRWKSLNCDQFVQHLRLLIPPSVLREAGIRYRIVVQGPGTMILTAAFEYYQIFYYSPCISRSIDFLLPGEVLSTTTDGIRACTACGLHDLRRRDGHNITKVDGRRNNAGRPTGRKRKRPCTTTSTRHMEPEVPSEAGGSIDTQDWPQARSDESDDVLPGVTSCCSGEAMHMIGVSSLDGHGGTGHPFYPVVSEDNVHTETNVGATWGSLSALAGEMFSLDVHSATVADRETRVERLARSIRGSDAVRQFAAAVDHSRSRADEQMRPSVELILQQFKDEEWAETARRGIQMAKGDRRDTMHRLCTRYNQVEFARGYQRLRGDNARMKKSMMTSIITATGMTPDTIKNNLKAGQAWDQVCGPVGVGLLCYIPCGGEGGNGSRVLAKDFKELAREENKAELKELHTLLGECQYVRSICAAARSWLQAIDAGEVVEYRWQRQGVCDWDILSESERLDMLQVECGGHLRGDPVQFDELAPLEYQPDERGGMPLMEGILALPDPWQLLLSAGNVMSQHGAVSGDEGESILDLPPCGDPGQFNHIEGSLENDSPDYGINGSSSIDDMMEQALEYLQEVGDSEYIL